MLDCLVIGGGPAGLTAAIYLARFHLTVTVIDGGESRAASIPWTHNHAGFPDGIAGADLLQRMRDQALRYGAVLEQGEVQRLDRRQGTFRAVLEDRTLDAATVLLATGVRDKRPAMPHALHDEALRRGLLRYCPICDGFEVTDASVAVLGSGEHGKAEALFLLGYTPHVTLVTQAGTGWSLARLGRELAGEGVRVLEGPARSYRLDDRQIHLELSDGVHAFDSVYPALGCESRTALAAMLGAESAENGAIRTDGHQQTSVPGLYAAGDVVEGINQISHAMGQAAVAATAIRNRIDDAAPLRRPRSESRAERARIA